MSNITRIGFKSAAFIFNSMESSMSTEKGAEFIETPAGVMVVDAHPERAKKRSLFPNTLVPWGNVAYVTFAKEVAAAPKPAGRKAKQAANEASAEEV